MKGLIKYSGNPVLSAQNIPYNSSLVFNAGVTKYNGKYIMVFRNDYGFFPGGQKDKGTNIGVAFSDDGLNWETQPTPWIEIKDDPEISRFYDPRLTVIDGRCYMCFAVDTEHGVRGGVAVTDDFDSYEILSMSTPDNRNMVLFPEKIKGNFIRLERPFPEYGRGYKERFDIWMSESPDCRYWGDTRLVLGTEDVPFANSKIGPGAPPVKTSAGWLTTFHAVWKHEDKLLKGWETSDWRKEYYGGLALLDLDDPSKVIGIYKEPLLKAEHEYEIDGFRGSVIFPGGMILEDDGEVKIYYGAADTFEAVATADVNYLISLCK
ncbi:MAG: glycoside hydrolase family 130 protein [Victivallales bacterium]|nr:glycoside hydrolase family 130 protein [Victivallales bacterium]